MSRVRVVGTGVWGLILGVLSRVQGQVWSLRSEGPDARLQGSTGASLIPSASQGRQGPSGV